MFFPLLIFFPAFPLLHAKKKVTRECLLGLHKGKNVYTHKKAFFIINRSVRREKKWKNGFIKIF